MQMLKALLGYRNSKAESETSASPETQIASGVQSATKDRAGSNEKEFGIKVLVEGEAPNVDIVAIHGLDGNRQSSWTADNTCCWLSDLLPKHVPRARILAYGYDAYTRNRDKLSNQFLNDIAQTFISKLAIFRELSDTMERPIIFIVHSLGGIVLEAALVHASRQHSGHLFSHKKIHISTYGIIFLGTPHQGVDIVQRVLPILTMTSRVMNLNTKLVKHLELHSARLQQLQSEFNGISSGFVIKSAYELLPTPLIGRKSVVFVPKHSAVMQGTANVKTLGIKADHKDISKFASEDADGFLKICGWLQDMVNDAPATIQSQWSSFHSQ